MGCTSSTEAVAVNTRDHPIHEKKREKEMTGGTEAMALTNHESSSTTTTAPPSIKFTKAATAVVGNWTLRYACWSQRGRDPDDASKPNQDSYSVHETLFSGSTEDAAFFGVYDGHGPHGQDCSQFVQERLPKLVKMNITCQKHTTESLSIEQVQLALHDSHVECNDDLRSSQINDSYSGTTSIALYVHHDGRITVCNVGDSRAILGTVPKTATTSDAASLVAVPLSKDQTPHRSDEALRCKRCGARILSFGQINPSSKQEDEDSDIEDPPRVWSPKGRYPGTAFTRSIGDAVAEPLGVFAEPEMITLKATPNEKLIVLASDGIFDVMSNQAVVDLCFKHQNDPTQACKAVVEKSHEEWMQNEECVDEASASYDDMTMICIFVDELRDESTAATATTKDAQLPPSTPKPQQRLTKRVRQKTLRNLEEMEEDQ